ncbi:terpenoid cyclases/Protein prenyltransferase [Coprinellus micaceus]|uniref:Terpenoid cyclases/Protein prenyltransferase n=1 Tax=Coprinellus micaceus TaxID=71717 RepID=A0A4Y7U0L1_COPMI|nr:terpenoid cyclases/Protein prenyltransferase [Coprinellus micaceus]
MPPDIPSFPTLQRSGHVNHSKRCLTGTALCVLPGDRWGYLLNGPSAALDRLGIVFYCLGIMDLLGALDTQSEAEREWWREWVWEQQQTRGESGSGFRPGTFMTAGTPYRPDGTASPAAQNLDTGLSWSSLKHDAPHLIMTYCALLLLAMLRDDFSRLDRPGLIKFLRTCQKPDGSFSTVPGDTESDLRTLYCAFAISTMLDDWSGIDVERALTFVESCRTYEGGYGQSSFCESHGGIAYIALASIYLAPPEHSKHHLSLAEREQSIRWFSGGFRGRTGKDADACYCFWCGAGLKILGADYLFNSRPMAEFLASCQFKFGGISKYPGEMPDPYHTYLSLAAISLYPLDLDASDTSAETWKLEPLDPLLNAKESTARWARQYIPARRP